jgi:hypothetical protein
MQQRERIYIKVYMCNPMVVGHLDFGMSQIKNAENLRGLFGALHKFLAFPIRHGLPYPSFSVPFDGVESVPAAAQRSMLLCEKWV